MTFQLWFLFDKINLFEIQYSKYY